MESPLDILFHERCGQIVGVRFKESPKRLRQKVVEIGRTAFRNERSRLRGQRRRQIGLDSDFFHVINIARG